MAKKFASYVCFKNICNKFHVLSQSWNNSSLENTLKVGKVRYWYHSGFWINDTRIRLML